MPEAQQQLLQIPKIDHRPHPQKSSKPLLEYGFISAAYLAAYLFLYWFSSPVAVSMQAAGNTWRVSLWFLPAGLMYVLLLAGGNRYLPVVLLGYPLAAALFSPGQFPPDLLVVRSAVFAAIYGLTAVFMRKVLRVEPVLHNLRDTHWLTIFGALTPLVAALSNTLILTQYGYMTGASNSLTVLETWIGESIGIITISPFLLFIVIPILRQVLIRFEIRPYSALPTDWPFHWDIPWWGWLEVSLQVGCLAASILATHWRMTIYSLNLNYLSFLPLFWIALRHGRWGSVLAILGLNVGVLAAYFSVGLNPENLYDLQLLLLAISITGLYLGIITSERREKDLQNRANEFKFQSLIQGSLEGFFLVDSSGMILDWNTAQENITGLRSDQAVGRPVWEVQASFSNSANPLLHGTNAYREVFLAMLRTGKGEFLNRLDERQIVRPDGTRRTIETIALSIPNDGHFMIAGIVRDITERRKTENQYKELLEIERKNRMVADILREIGMVLSSTLDSEAILDLVLEQAAKLVPYDSGCLFVVDGPTARVIHSRGYEQFGQDTALAITDTEYVIDSVQNLKRMRQTRQPVVVADTAQFSFWVDRPGFRFIRSWIGAPLIVDGEVRFFISLDKTEAGYYSAAHANSLALYAERAALALQNSRLYSETAESLQREHRLSEITRALSGKLELDVLFPTVLELATQIVGADAGTLGLIDETGEVMTYPYDYNISAQPDPARQALPRGTGLAWMVVERGSPIRMNDINEFAHSPESLRKLQVHAFLGVPLLTGRASLGALGFLNFTKNKTFSSRDADIAESIGLQAAIAIQNARLFTTVQRRAEEAETLRGAIAAVVSALDQGDVLGRILAELKKIVPFDSSSIFLLEDQQLVLVAQQGLDERRAWVGLYASSDDPFFLEMRQTHRTIILADAQKDPRFHEWDGAQNIHGWIGVPLILRDDMIGYLTIDSHHTGTYSENDAVLAQAFANEAAVAISNARLFTEVQRLAITDALTGLANRRHFFDVGDKEVERSLRYNDPLSVIMLDVDYFKQVNDTYGHLVGDQALAEVARVCRESVRDIDLAAHYGGDEFVVLLPETSSERAAIAAERIRKTSMELCISTEKGILHLTVTQGVASLEPGMQNLQELLSRADKALYSAKNSGRNRICIWPDVGPAV
jgi:diguanylate cyclase (GGDEF)-like protein/PAS domain S-box-containing protein